MIVFRPLFESVMGSDPHPDASYTSVRIIAWGMLAVVTSVLFFQLNKKLRSKSSWLIEEIVFVGIVVSSGTVGVGSFLLMYSLFL